MGSTKGRKSERGDKEVIHLRYVKRQLLVLGSGPGHMIVGKTGTERL